jgi:hypothetical protein
VIAKESALEDDEMCSSAGSGVPTGVRDNGY